MEMGTGNDLQIMPVPGAERAHPAWKLNCVLHFDSLVLGLPNLFKGIVCWKLE